MNNEERGAIVRGAVVTLNSGGPDMTVQHADNTSGIVCQWFTEHGLLQYGMFPAVSLKVRRRPSEVAGE